MSSEMSWNPFDLMTKASEQAEASSLQSSFGQLLQTIHYLKFGEAGERPTDITPQEYGQATEGGKKATKGYMIKVTFSIDPSKFSPSATFLYERQVAVVGKEQVQTKGKYAKTDGETGKKYVKSDWIATVLPSIEAVFGSMAEYNRRMNEGPVWVEVADSPSQTSTLNTIKFVRLFKDLNECKAAWSAKYGGSANGNGHAAIPADVVNTMRLLKGAIKDKAALETAVKADPMLNQYAMEDLLKVG